MTLPPELYQATESLIENLLASESFLAYQRSATDLNANPQARFLLERLSTLQAELRRKQSNNSLAQVDIDDLRTVQAQVQENVTILAYAQAQQEAITFLREVNQGISQLLGVDFAALAKQKTCC